MAVSIAYSHYSFYKCLPDIYQLMCLQTKSPLRMLHHAIHRFGRIAARARLKKEMPGGQLLINSNILPFIHHLHFIHTRNFQLYPLLGRAGHPIYIIRQRTGTVCFNADILSRLVQTSTNSRSIQREGSPPVSITVAAGYLLTSVTISSSDISMPSSCCVSQKRHFRLQPEKRIKTAGVPVWYPSPCKL